MKKIKTNNKTKLPGLLTAMMLLLAAAGSVIGQSTQSPAAPEANGTTKLESRTSGASGKGLEVELIEVRRLMAIPNRIQRHAGKFILMVRNEDRTNFDEAFVLDSSSVGDGVVGPSPLARFGGKGLTDGKNRSSILIDGQPGEWDLKSASTGKILCHFHFQ